MSIEYKLPPVSGTEIDPTGASSGDVLTYDGTKFAPAAPAGGGSGDMLLGTSQTVTAAKTFNSGTLKQNNAGNTQAHTLASSATAARTWTLPDATDTAVGQATTDTLTNKTLDGPTMSNTIAGTYTIGGTPTLGADLIVTSGKYIKATNNSTVPPAITWTAPTLLNSWANFGSGYNNAGYFKDALGFVHLRGLVSNSSSTAVIFTLPAGYRPANTNDFVGAGATGGILIDSSGNVSPASATTAACFDGIHFYAEG